MHIGAFSNLAKNIHIETQSREIINFSYTIISLHH